MPLRTLEALLSQKGAFWLVHVMLSPCAVLWPPNSLHCAVPAQAVPSVLAAGSVVPDQATAWALRCNCSDIPPSRSCFRAGRRCTALLSAACRVLAPRAGGRGVEAARPLAPVRLYVAVCARRPHPSPSRSCTAWAPAAPRWREARGGVGAGAFPWCHDIISCVDVGSRDIPTFCLTPRSLLSWCFLAPDIVPHRPRRRLFDRSNAGAERCCHAAGRRQARYTSVLTGPPTAKLQVGVSASTASALRLQLRAWARALARARVVGAVEAAAPPAQVRENAARYGRPHLGAASAALLSLQPATRVCVGPYLTRHASGCSYGRAPSRRLRPYIDLRGFCGARAVRHAAAPRRAPHAFRAPCAAGVHQWRGGRT